MTRSRPVGSLVGKDDNQKCTKGKARSWLRCRSGGEQLLVLGVPIWKCINREAFSYIWIIILEQGKSINVKVTR